MNTPTEKDNDVFINQVNNSVVYRNETGLTNAMNKEC